MRKEELIPEQTQWSQWDSTGRVCESLELLLWYKQESTKICLFQVSSIHKVSAK